jgi:AraC family transcriptional regulator of adaptative response/methylated-DNA-[protein]-cysteine methyltransferase
VPGSHPHLSRLREQLEEYFRGERRRFDVPLDLGGTAFQQSVWSRLQGIPFGGTRSYVEVASQVGKRDAVRAVGQANGRNPVAIVVPCHRVVGADGSLSGYGGGLWRKRWLLEHERAVLRLAEPSAPAPAVSRSRAAGSPPPA